jgi:hypothetical protein
MLMSKMGGYSDNFACDYFTKFMNRTGVHGFIASGEEIDVERGSQLISIEQSISPEDSEPHVLAIHRKMRNANNPEAPIEDINLGFNFSTIGALIKVNSYFTEYKKRVHDGRAHYVEKRLRYPPQRRFSRFHPSDFRAGSILPKRKAFSLAKHTLVELEYFSTLDI